MGGRIRHESKRGARRAKRRLGLAAPLLACALPLLVPWLPGQERGGGRARRDADDGSETPETIDVRVRTRAAKFAREVVRFEAQSGPEAQRRQSPFLLARSDGRTTQGMVEWTPNEGDRIVLCDLAPDGSAATRGVVSEVPGEILRPVGVLDAQGRACIFWTELVDGAPQLRGAREEGDRFSAPVTLTSGPLPSMNVEAVAHSDGRIYLAWETETPPAPGSARGSRDVVVAAAGEDLRLGERVLVGAGRFSDLDAGIASSGGRLWIVWVGYGGRDYDVKLRALDPANGELSEVIEVSADGASDDLRPALAAGSNGELWVAWDRIENPNRGESMPTMMSTSGGEGAIGIEVRVACVRDGRVWLPRSTFREIPDGVVPGAPLLSTGGGIPRLCIDAAGRLWIAYRRLERSGDGQTHYTFPLLLQRLGADGWSAPIEIEHNVTLPEQPALARAGDGVTAGLGVAPFRADVTAPSEPRLVERVAGPAALHFHPFGDRLDDPIVTGESHFEVPVGATGAGSWRVYWGDLHRHSSVSRCMRGTEPTPSDRWEWGRDVHLLDFMALTDHVRLSDSLANRNLDKLCWLYQSPSFCTLAGFEWSTRKYGHHNVILPGRLSPVVATNISLEALYSRLRPGECVTIPHHSADVKFSNDFSKVDDRFTRLIEVYQACRGSYEFDGCFKQAPRAKAVGRFAQDALNDGHKFGIIASTDHGFGQAYACVLAKSLDRAAIFEALVSRRTYGATTKGMLVVLRVDDAIMGEQVTCTAPPRVQLQAAAGVELADVVVFRNGRIWRTARRRDSAIHNPFAPAALVVRLPLRPNRSRAEWTLEVSTATARFEPVEDRRGCATIGESPGWSLRGGTATFRWPSGYSADSECAEYALHLHASEDAGFELRTPAGTTASTFAELLQRPMKFEAPGGECTLAIVPRDAAVDLEHGLGTREFVAEWEDGQLQAGHAWYYARVIQTDGEIAWSSPVFVHRR